MKYSKHDNILPFYGVSTTVCDFSLVFPWCKNGDIKEYLKKNPYVDRYDLVSKFNRTTHVDAYSNPTDSYWERSVDYNFCITMI